ncbi:MAG: hypothetical protein ABL994_19710, partial [Verrucomicrobiales bacterium]
MPIQAPLDRRSFLADVGRGMLVATVGIEVAASLKLSEISAAEVEEKKLSFGTLEPLVSLMQETPATSLLPLLADRLRSGTDLRQ